MQQKSFTLQEMKGDLLIYFNWSANVLVPIRPGAADTYLKENRSSIQSIAQELLKQVPSIPEKIYRGIIMRHAVEAILPHERFQYLSFSADRSVAEHFADYNGFGSEIMDVANRLGKYGYIIEHIVRISEILFHYHFLSILPYEEAFTLYGIDGKAEIEGLRKQKEIVIFQPTEPFTSFATLF